MSESFWKELQPNQEAIASTPFADIHVMPYTTIRNEQRYRTVITSKNGVIYNDASATTFADALSMAMTEYNSLLWDEYERVRNARALA